MEYDVAVVGAGPSGATLANRLSEEGLDVVLADNAVGEKACSGILTANFARKYRIPADLIEKKLKGVRIGSQSKQITINRFDELSINKKRFNSFLLTKATDNGTTFLKSEFIDFKRKNNRIHSRIGRNIIKSKMLVAADGADSRIVKQCLLGEKKLASFLQYEIEKQGEEFFNIFYGFTKNGYAWISPKRDSILVGIGSSSDPDLKERLDRFMKDGQIKEKVKGRIIEKKTGRIPVSGPIKKTYTDNILVIGDAGGFVTPYEGEGIYYAMRSAEIAGDTIIRAFDLKDYSKKVLSRYESAWKKEFNQIFAFLSPLPLLINNEHLLDSFLKRMIDDEGFKNVIAKILFKDDFTYTDYIKGLTSTLKVLGDYYGRKYLG